MCKNREKERIENTIQGMARLLVEVICTMSIISVTLFRYVINVRWRYQHYGKSIDRVRVYMDINAEGLPDGRCYYDFLRFALFKDAAFFKHNDLVAVLGC